MARWTFLRSKTFWGVSIAGETVASLLAYDRWRLGRIREEHLEEARAMGLEPSSETRPLRKVTLLTMAQDPSELRKIRRVWREYAVELFTAAGCDYQMIEADASKLNKELDKRLPVPDGQLPEPGKLPKKYFFPDNWVRPTVCYWLRGSRDNEGASAPSQPTRPDTPSSPRENSPAVSPPIEEGAADVVSSEDRLARQLWREQRPDPRSSNLFDDGIVALDGPTHAAVVRGVEEGMEGVRGGGGEATRPTLKVGYIPCDPSSSWMSSLYLVLVMSRVRLAERV